jgi:hypothetical protein
MHQADYQWDQQGQRNTDSFFEKLNATSWESGCVNAIVRKDPPTEMADKSEQKDERSYEWLYHC